MGVDGVQWGEGGSWGEKLLSTEGQRGLGWMSTALLEGHGLAAAFSSGLQFD